MPFERYLGEGKIELLKREIELSMGIQLKLVPWWLISKNCLQEQQKSSNKRGSAIVIIVDNESEVEAELWQKGRKNHKQTIQKLFN